MYTHTCGVETGVYAHIHVEWKLEYRHTYPWGGGDEICNYHVSSEEVCITLLTFSAIVFEGEWGRKFG